jgi:hypothetical protein
MAEMESALKRFGVSEHEIKHMERWDRVRAIAYHSRESLLEGKFEGMKRFARQARQTTQMQMDEYKKKVQQIFEKQIQALSSKNLPDYTHEVQDDPGKIIDEKTAKKDKVKTDARTQSRLQNEEEKEYRDWKAAQAKGAANTTNTTTTTDTSSNPSNPNPPTATPSNTLPIPSPSPMRTPGGTPDVHGNIQPRQYKIKVAGRHGTLIGDATRFRKVTKVLKRQKIKHTITRFEADGTKQVETIYYDDEHLIDLYLEDIDEDNNFLRLSSELGIASEMVGTLDEEAEAELEFDDSISAKKKKALGQQLKQRRETLREVKYKQKK